MSDHDVSTKNKATHIMSPSLSPTKASNAAVKKVQTCRRGTLTRSKIVTVSTKDASDPTKSSNTQPSVRISTTASPTSYHTARSHDISTHQSTASPHKDASTNFDAIPPSRRDTASCLNHQTATPPCFGDTTPTRQLTTPTRQLTTPTSHTVSPQYHVRTSPSGFNSTALVSRLTTPPSTKMSPTTPTLDYTHRKPFNMNHSRTCSFVTSPNSRYSCDKNSISDCCPSMDWKCPTPSKPYERLIHPCFCKNPLCTHGEYASKTSDCCGVSGECGDCYSCWEQVWSPHGISKSTTGVQFDCCPPKCREVDVHYRHHYTPCNMTSLFGSMTKTALEHRMEDLLDCHRRKVFRSKMYSPRGRRSRSCPPRTRSPCTRSPPIRSPLIRSSLIRSPRSCSPRFFSPCSPYSTNGILRCKPRNPSPSARPNTEISYAGHSRTRLKTVRVKAPKTIGITKANTGKPGWCYTYAKQIPKTASKIPPNCNCLKCSNCLCRWLELHHIENTKPVRHLWTPKRRDFKADDIAKPEPPRQVTCLEFEAFMKWRLRSDCKGGNGDCEKYMNDNKPKRAKSSKITYWYVKRESCVFESCKRGCRSKWKSIFKTTPLYQLYDENFGYTYNIEGENHLPTTKQCCGFCCFYEIHCKKMADSRTRRLSCHTCTPMLGQQCPPFSKSENCTSDDVSMNDDEMGLPCTVDIERFQNSYSIPPKTCVNDEDCIPQSYVSMYDSNYGCMNDHVGNSKPLMPSPCPVVDIEGYLKSYSHTKKCLNDFHGVPQRYVSPNMFASTGRSIWGGAYCDDSEKSKQANPQEDDDDRIEQYLSKYRASRD